MPGFQIEPCGSAHGGLLAGLHQACFDRPWDEAAFSQLLLVQARFGAIALADVNATEAAADNARSPVGFVLASAAGGDAEILTICVLPAHQRRGVGAALIGEVERRAREAGAKRLFLEARAGAEELDAFYRQAGFEPIGRRRGYYAGKITAADAVIWRKAL